jgi:GTP-binding protein
MLDAKIYDEEDKKIFYSLQELGKKICLMINKVDNEKMMNHVMETFKYGVDDCFYISIAHNKGITDFKKWLYNQIPLGDKQDAITKFIVPENQIHVGIIGRVNVGKSSLLNAFLGEERSVVSPIAGTTIDPVDEMMEYNGKIIKFVDTAGVRRKGKIKDLEKYALMRTRKILERTHIALLVLDSSVELSRLDEKIFSLVDEFNLGVIVIFNKWDINACDYKEMVDKYKNRFRFLSYAPFLLTSAITNRGIEPLKEKILEIYGHYTYRIPTSKLNDIIKTATVRHQLPVYRGKPLKIYYATQYDIRPPRISLMMNRATMHFSYKRYLSNFIRNHFKFVGIPVMFKFESRTKNTKVKKSDEGDDNNIDEEVY